MYNEKVTTCEDCLSLLTGVEIPRVSARSYQDFGLHLKQNDATILISIAKQLSKKIALTDRQYELVKTKLINEYKDQFDKVGVDLDTVLNELKYPLREVDRSHWVKVMTYNDENILGIRFPFNKKIIDRVEELRRLNPRTDVKYDKHTHYFTINTKNIKALVQLAKKFEHKFSIQKDIQEAYDKIIFFEENKKDYVPGIYDNKLVNLCDSAVQKLREELGSLDEDNYVLYMDRRYLYGLHHFENVEEKLKNLSILGRTIVERDHATVIIDKNKFTMNNIIEGIFELQRFPLLIVLEDKTAHDDLVTTYNSLKGVVDNKDISVLFRKDGQDPFNDYIKQHSLNNPVDINTKVVYINSTKLPKPLLQSKFRANCVIHPNKKGLTWNNTTGYAQSCDLQIIYDDKSNLGHWDRHQRKFIHGNM